MSDRAVRVRAGLLLGTSAVLIAGLLSSSAGAAVPPALDWAVQLGGDFDLHGNGIAVDGSGNVYTIGDFRRTVDFDPGPGTANLSSNGGADVFVSKLDSAGNYIWARHWGSTTGDKGFDVAVDATGNVYTTGNFSGTVDFDPGSGTANLTSNGGADVFVSKLDPSGNHVWTRHWGSPNDDEGLGIALDSTGNVYTTGNFSGTVDFDPGPGTANLIGSGGADVFVSKLDAAGNYVWARHFGSTNDDEGLGIAVDGSGTVHTTGTFSGTVDFDPGGGADLTSNGGTDVFVSKLDAAGNHVWARHFGSAYADRGVGIAVDGSGNVYTTGSFRGTVDFDPGAGTANLPSNGGADVFVSMLDSVGNHVWARHWGSSSLDRVRGIAVDGTGNTHTIGEFFQTVDFDPGAGTAYLGSAGMEDVFVSKLDPSGNYVWAIQFSGPLIEQGHGIAVDGSGTVHTTGWFSYADFDPSTGVFVLESDGSRDAFVSQLVIPPSCNGLLVTWDMNTQGPFTGTPGDDVVLGTDGADVIDTGYGNDTVCGLGGDDVITTRGGIDWVDGGDGDDTIRLGARDDTAYGGNGADVINGGGGADHIEGGAGNDVIRDSFGADTSILGNNGDDVFVVGRGTANVYDGGGGTDRIDYRGMPSGVSVWLHDSVAQRDHHGTVEDTLISIEEARGSRHDDWLEGDDGDNVLIGHPGNDTLVGMDGDDTLVGDRGDDQLYGGDGWDYLVGGDGAEVTGDYCLDGEDIHPSCEHTVP